MNEICAVVQTDIVDSTKTAAALGDERMRRIWEEHDRGARALLRAWRGLEVSKADGFLLLFERVADAAEYALAYHAFLETMSCQLRARVGIHFGKVAHRHNPANEVAFGANPLDVTGLAVPIAARVMTIAEGGQTFLSAAARADLGDAPIRVQSHGHWRLKGLTEPIELFEVTDREGTFTPPPDGEKVYRVYSSHGIWIPLAKLKHTLNAERDAFVGRNGELQEIARRFQSGGRLVTLVGIGGIGKTRLAQRFGWTWLSDFAGGVWFCDVSQATDLDGLVRAIAQGLELSLGRGDPIAQIANALAGRGRCLILVDNFEQIASLAESTLGTWLNFARECCFLVTSREVLGIPGEETLALSTLELSDGADLFRRRASAAARDFRPDAEDERAIGKLTLMLDGLPLAIELAAARIRVMPPKTLLDRMGERFKLLSARSGRSPRQATLQATFDWSWQLLSAAEQRALAELSVFEGGFTLDAAEAILKADTPSSSGLDLVQSLVEKSLIRQLTPRRLGMLRSLQEYAAIKLGTKGQFPGSGAAIEADVRTRHWRYFADLDHGRVVVDGCADIDNLIVACRRAAAAGDANSAVKSLAAAWEALRLRGPYSEAVELATRVRAVETLDPGQVAIVEWATGAAQQQLGKVPEARRRFEEALLLARSVSARATEARLLCSLSELLRIAGRIETAQSHLAGSLSLAQGLGEARLELNALNGLGALHEHQGQLDESRHYYERALALARELGDRRAEGGLLGNLGSLEHNSGNLDDAVELYEKAAALAQESGDRKWESNVRCNLGLLLHDRGLLDPARSQLEAALEMARMMGNARLECAVLCNLGLVLETAGDSDGALTHYRAAVTAAGALGDRRSEGQFRGYLGLLLARRGEFAESGDCLAIGDALLTEVADALSLALLLCNAAEAQLLGGRLDLAWQSLERASPIAERVGAGTMSELGRKLEALRAQLSVQGPIQGSATTRRDGA